MSSWNFELAKQSNKDLPEPFGYCKKFEIEAQSTQQKDKIQVLEKKLMEVATSGKGQILQIFLMNFMMGNSLNIFMIFFLFQSVYSPLKSMIGVNDVFMNYEGKGINLLQYKLIYLAIQVVLFSVGIYKIYTLGLLPLSAADWIDIVPLHSQQEQVFSLAN